MAVDQERMDELMGTVVGELGATLGVGLVVLGERTGIWAAMAGAGPLTSEQVAERSGAGERYAREWLRAMAAAHEETCRAEGRPVTLTAQGWFARIMLHEYDHLQGTLYVDRLDRRWSKKWKRARIAQGCEPGRSWLPGSDPDPFGH